MTINMQEGKKETKLEGKKKKGTGPTCRACACALSGMYSMVVLLTLPMLFPLKSETFALFAKAQHARMMRDRKVDEKHLDGHQHADVVLRRVEL
jgi:hypothetical protein